MIIALNLTDFMFPNYMDNDNTWPVFHIGLEFAFLFFSLLGQLRIILGSLLYAAFQGLDYSFGSPKSFFPSAKHFDFQQLFHNALVLRTFCILSLSS